MGFANIPWRVFEVGSIVKVKTFGADAKPIFGIVIDVEKDKCLIDSGINKFWANASFDIFDATPMDLINE